jgi:hypothetical protein
LGRAKLRIDRVAINAAIEFALRCSDAERRTVTKEV